jgi:hypothetical protein
MEEIPKVVMGVFAIPKNLKIEPRNANCENISFKVFLPCNFHGELQKSAVIRTLSRAT